MCLYLQVQAQQLPMFNQYRDYGFVVNPAMSAVERQEAAGVFFRYQWTRMPKAPMTAFATFDTHRFMDDYNMGVSGYISHDRTGPIMSNGLGLNYSYHIEIPSWEGDSHYVSLGIQAGIFQHRLDGDQLIINDINDPLVIGDATSSFLPELGLGLYYYNNYVGFGFSVPQILGLTANFNQQGLTSPVNKERHYYGMVHGKIPLGHYETSYLLPSIWAKYAPHSPLNLNINIKFLLDEKFFIGIGYATSNMLTGELGVLINERYKLGYSYSTQFTPWNTYLGDSHEALFIIILDSDNIGYY